MFLNSFTVICLLVVNTCFSAPTDGPSGMCPEDYGDIRPVLLVSLDGFRTDYLERGLTPTLKALAEKGVTTHHMISTYPTLTFPNHYTIVTGAYPEYHGIIANKFYDPEFGKFSYTTNTTKEGKWWGAEPIWNTVTNQGKKSATYFWPGSEADIGGKRPSYWYSYNGSVPFEERADKVLEWLQLPNDKRPSWISLYMSEPDHTGHTSGPDSLEEDGELLRVELVMKRLIDGIKKAKLTPCINIIVISDHGMAPSGPEYMIKLKDYIPDLYDKAYVSSGAFTRIEPKDKSQEAKCELMEQLVCQRSEMRVFEKEGLPTRFHFSNNRRIEPIVLDFDPGYTGSISSNFYLNGQHGYDNYFQLMNALFIASGPAFKEEVEIERFQNLELYNLMCLLAGVKPAPNNGTEGALYHVLLSPPDPPALPKENPPPTSSFPKGDLKPLLDMAQCSSDLSDPEEWLQSFNFTPSKEELLRSIHLPWGVPHSHNLSAGLTLLHHTDHVTAYSTVLRMPLWSSFTIDKVPQGTGFASWSSDIRLTPNTTITCPDYDNLQGNITMQPLFPSSLSHNGSLERVPYLVSNAVPMNPVRVALWNWLMGDLTLSWYASHGPLNVIIGPLFDNDADSHVDDFDKFSIPEVPSDVFAIVTRCLEPVKNISLCSSGSLDALTFIIPMFQPVSNCLDQYQYALEFSARVHDVELATGLTFYPNLTFADRATITLRINHELWAK